MKAMTSEMSQSTGLWNVERVGGADAVRRIESPLVGICR